MLHVSTPCPVEPVSAWTYPIALALISIVVLSLERAFPWRRWQRALRPALGWDLMHLVFNGHLLGVIVYGIAARWLLPPMDAWLADRGLHGIIYRGEASDWPVWVQIVVALLVIDLVQWCVHNMLHRVPWLWEFHKCHHSVADGEMDWIVSFRFQWTEVVVYKLVQYLPLAWFGFGVEAVMVHAIFGTFIGHLNHANLNWDWGPLRYVLNSPRMHIWHHDYDGNARTTVNYGIIFSMWDWMFGTAKLPPEPPRRLGFEGVDAYPRNFFAAEAWFLRRLLPMRHATLVATVLGMALIAAGWWLARVPL